MTTNQYKLFQPARIGVIDVVNRVVMAPLTRCRADATKGDGLVAT